MSHIANNTGRIGFIERFAIADDRALTLKELIPGTEDYYYFHCLHYLNENRFVDAEKMLVAWRKRHDRNNRVKTIEHRTALLKYGENPAKTIDYLKYELGVYCDHERDVIDQTPCLPTRLDPNEIAYDTLKKDAFFRYSETTDGFELAALPDLLKEKMDPAILRHLLNRLTLPDIDRLPQFIVADLKNKNSRGFGSMAIHNNLTIAQLDRCLQLMPELKNETRFISTYLKRLHPNPDSCWETDPDKKRAYLTRLWDFAMSLEPTHNSLKAHILYHVLRYFQESGAYHVKAFKTYLKLPRRKSYMNTDYIHKEQHLHCQADLNAGYSADTLLPTVGDDEPLVRDYLQFIFRQAKPYQEYLKWLNDKYVTEIFAETMIVNGLGDMEEWYAMLPPEKYQRLKERVELEFLPDNPKYFKPDDNVTLKLRIKNIKTLIIKIYEINTVNYYIENQKEINTGINLDGLVANRERIENFDENPLISHVRQFLFATLKGRGVFVIEFIGNGKSSRALIRKGQLRYHERKGVAGHRFTIIDENNEPVPDATILLSGHAYEADKKGCITIPYSTRPTQQPIIIKHHDFAVSDSFYHNAEDYGLEAGMYVDREALLKHNKASIVVRPSVTLNNTPITLKVLSETALEITTLDHDGITARKTIRDFELYENQESTCEFQVPDRLQTITLKLTAKVRNISQNQDQDLSVRKSFTLNKIDQTEQVENLLLGKWDNTYVFDLLGKSGEPKIEKPVHFTIKFKHFVDHYTTALQTDENGRIHLGQLSGAVWISAGTNEGGSQIWYLNEDQCAWPAQLHARDTDTISIPYVQNAPKPTRSEMSLLELRGNINYKDCFQALSLKNGFITIERLPAGDYDFRLKNYSHSMRIRISGKKKTGPPLVKDGFVMNPRRHLEVVKQPPLQITGGGKTVKGIEIRLANTSPATRVHVFATNYLPAYSVFNAFNKVTCRQLQAKTLAPKNSSYLSGRDIGDEYRYILDRKFAKKYPGNMLKKPQLLLNPWAIRKTEADQQEASEGNAWHDSAPEPISTLAGAAAGAAAAPESGTDGFVNLDFLKFPGVTLLNLVPDRSGIVRIEDNRIEQKNHLHIIALDQQNTVYRTLSSDQPEYPQVTPTELAPGLSANLHFTQKNQISIVEPDETFRLADITTSSFAVFDSLAKVYQLYMTLSEDPNLTKFHFILDWFRLKPSEKSETYSEYACHELNFFIFKKDPEFFRGTVLPYIENKKEKTFLDQWLIARGHKNAGPIQCYLAPWHYSRLNIVEKILLASSLKGEAVNTARHITDLLNLTPPDVEHFNYLFTTAIKGTELDTADTYGFETASGDAAATKIAEMPEPPQEPAGSAAPPPPIMKKQKASGEMDDFLNDMSMEECEMMPPEMDDDRELDDFYDEDEDLKKRDESRRFYQKPDKTQEWAENNYYHRLLEDQNADLIPVNGFWADYAGCDKSRPFYSKHLAEASKNFTEMMFALSVLDLPFEAEAHQVTYKGPQMDFRAKSPLVVFHREIMEEIQEETQAAIPILISQNFFRHDDRYRYEEDGRHYDKFVTDEFLTQVVYGCRIVVTNPSSAPRKLEALIEIPQGTVPVLNSHYTRTVTMDLNAYHSMTVEYYFYFPAAGNFNHFPVHVAKNGRLMAYADPLTFKVVEKPSQTATDTWDYISQTADTETVFEYLNQNNIHRIQLDRIAWRMKDNHFYERVIKILTERHVYNHALWSYALEHQDTANISEFLKFSTDLLNTSGDYINCELLHIDPVIRKKYQHLEYSPLVNPRIHKLGKDHRILNEQFNEQYHKLMSVLAFKPTMDDDDLMAVVYYLLLQDRVDEAVPFFKRVTPENLESRLQYDYFDLYLAYSSQEFEKAGDIARKYSDYPVDRRQKIFAAALQQIDEVITGAPDSPQGDPAEIIDKEDRTQVQAQLASTEPAFEFKIEAGQVSITCQAVSQFKVNYYLMDIELLFSKNPFVQKVSGNFSNIMPNLSEGIKLAADQTEHTFDLPDQFKSQNVLVEIESAGLRKSEAFFANSLNVHIIKNYGQLTTKQAKTGSPLSTVYIKVYARFHDGRIKFYKDGYTDPRGKFDYTSLNTDDLDHVQSFAILISSEEYGAVVREVAPPKR